LNILKITQAGEKTFRNRKKFFIEMSLWIKGKAKNILNIKEIFQRNENLIR
jgi:hypothetical protein